MTIQQLLVVILVVDYSNYTNRISLFTLSSLTINAIQYQYTYCNNLYIHHLTKLYRICSSTNTDVLKDK